MTKITKKGFTLIELLVVIAIIGLLSTLAVVALGNARMKARDAKRVADIKSIVTALELFNTEAAAYPNAGGAAVAYSLGSNSGATPCLAGTVVCTVLSKNAGVATPGFSNAAGTTVYMGSLPSDPQTPGTICAPASTGSCNYAYRTELNVSIRYCIQFWLEGDPDGNGALIGGLARATQDGLSMGACP